MAPIVKVSVMVRFSIDGLDLTLNCVAYAHTAAHTQSVGLHPNAGLNLMLPYMQTHQSVKIRCMGFEQVQLVSSNISSFSQRCNAEHQQKKNNSLLISLLFE